jgi:hypothetical protein
MRFVVLIAILSGAPLAAAEPRRVATLPEPSAETTVAAAAPTGQARRGIEVNVLWQFFPGGINELRYIQPVLRTGEPTFGGALVIGTYSDFASRVVRDDSHGKVANLSAKLGWRQFLVRGVHVEASANLGWRHEAHRPPEDMTVDGFQVRLWTLAGYEQALSPRFYVNARGGAGFHIYRSDELAALEKRVAVGADLNLGVRF